MAALFVFLDGVGLGDDDVARNPLAAARLPVLRGLLDGAPPVAAAAPRRTALATLVPLDATLGVTGLPQSGTGQTALLTGENAAERFGRHFGPWVPTVLRPLLAERSLLARALAAGLDVAFANAYPEEVLEADRGPMRIAPPFAARAAGLLTRHTAALARGDAVASEITNDGWRNHLHRLEVPEIAPERAGRNLARIAASHHLTLYAHYATDVAGHRGGLPGGIAALERVDAFLGGVLDALPAGTNLLVASDHGNIEDVTAGHTRNPALGLAAGPGHAELAARLRSITDVAPAVLKALGA